MKFWTSKKFWFGAGILLLVVLFLAALSWRAKSTQLKSANNSLNSLLKSALDSNSFKDQDKDGLLDWQEAVYGADPQNPDTDKDGYLDGEEVSSGHNPAKPAPNDLLNPQNTVKQTKTTNQELNLTSQISQGIIQNVLAEKNSSEIGLENFSLDSLDPNQFLNQAIVDASLFFSPPEIPDSELKISPDNSQEAIKQYFDTAIKTMALRFVNLKKTDLEAIQEALQQQNSSALEQNIQAYNLAFQDLKQLTIPSSWQDIHRRGLQMLWLTEQSLLAVKNFQTDPLKAMVGLKQYEGLITAFIDLNYEMNQLLKKQGVIS